MTGCYNFSLHILSFTLFGLISDPCRLSKPQKLERGDKDNKKWFISRKSALLSRYSYRFSPNAIPDTRYCGAAVR